MAVNCSVVPRAIEGLVGVTATETRVFGAASLLLNPAQTVAKANISKKTNLLLDFINAHSGRN